MQDLRQGECRPLASQGGLISKRKPIRVDSPTPLLTSQQRLSLLSHLFILPLYTQISSFFSFSHIHPSTTSLAFPLNFIWARPPLAIAHRIHPHPRLFPRLSHPQPALPTVPHSLAHNDPSALFSIHPVPAPILTINRLSLPSAADDGPSSALYAPPSVVI